jgi:hypothetical protein
MYIQAARFHLDGAIKRQDFFFIVRAASGKGSWLCQTKGR